MKVVTFLLDLLYPQRCAFCHDFLETSGDGLCAHCRTGLPFAQNGGRQRFSFVRACVSPLNYEGDVRASLLRYKFGGATGNMNAHKVAFPDIDWPAFADRFVASLGLKRSFPTTQIDHYDNLAAIFDCLRRINTILIDLCRDIWTYISMEYFHQQVAKNEVGSSAMPHKVNPIDFENAEGNLGMADAVLTFLSMKLPISRLQRDLTDSTVQRNIGVPVAHGLIALASLKKGLGKLILNRPAIDADLHRNWAVVAEAIQTILRRENYPNPYETLKNLTRTGAAIDERTIEDFVNGLDVSESVKEELRSITPWNYTGF